MLNLILYTNKMKISFIKITLIKLQNLEKIIHIMLIH